MGIPNNYSFFFFITYWLFPCKVWHSGAHIVEYELRNSLPFFLFCW